MEYGRRRWWGFAAGNRRGRGDVVRHGDEGSLVTRWEQRMAMIVTRLSSSLKECGSVNVASDVRK